MKRMFLSALLLFGILALLSTGALAATVTVVCPTQSLQTAIDSALPGDTLTITGTCHENISIYKNNITLDGAGTGIINGPNTTTAGAVTIVGNLNVITRLHITGGYHGVIVAAGGINTLVGNTLTGSTACGISVAESAAARILGNTISNQGQHGIMVTDGSSARIGFRFSWDTSPILNTIQNNGGHGIFATRASSVRVVGNTILGNTGSGIYVSGDSHADASDNNISGNKVDGITVIENSGLNLGANTGTDMFSTPNTTVTTNKNVGYGVLCGLGAYVNNRRGTLTGKKGAIITGNGGINNTIP